MAQPYDDDRYLQWATELHALVYEWLNTEGNDKNGLEAEVENAISEAEANL
jgi:hypothetical protein